MTLKEEKDKFILVAKRILKKDLSKDPNTLSTYYADIVSAYNSLITYITDNFNVVNPEKQQQYTREINFIRTKFLQCLQNLQLDYVFLTDILEKVDDAKVTQKVNHTLNIYESTDDLSGQKQNRNQNQGSN